jgi:chloramphenicol-sensitive protein RarD
MNKGFLSAASAYILWGFLPIYLKLIHEVPALQTTAHRVTWSFFFILIILMTKREMKAFWSSLTRRSLLVYFTAAVLLACNWLVYVNAVTDGHVLDASLGYFINPLVNVMLGTLFFKERLRLFQWVPVAMAALGVTYLTVSQGSAPVVALELAFTFGLYGLVKKIAPLGSLYGLMLETAILFIPAVGYLIYAEAAGAGVYVNSGAGVSILLMLLGVVTAVPLLLFATGARSVSMTTLGLLQYISPTLQFFTAVLLYGEPFSVDRLIGFGIIWIALAFFSIEGMVARRKANLAAAAAATVTAG